MPETTSHGGFYLNIENVLTIIGGFLALMTLLWKLLLDRIKGMEVRLDDGAEDFTDIKVEMQAHQSTLAEREQQFIDFTNSMTLRHSSLENDVKTTRDRILSMEVHCKTKEDMKKEC